MNWFSRKEWSRHTNWRKHLRLKDLEVYSKDRCHTASAICLSNVSSLAYLQASDSCCKDPASCGEGAMQEKWQTIQAGVNCRIPRRANALEGAMHGLIKATTSICACYRTLWPQMIDHELSDTRDSWQNKSSMHQSAISKCRISGELGLKSLHH